jgi:3-hydroxyisobutyrate dehydrogenase-like beta-hydroxyacid dehydrogenase
MSELMMKDLKLAVDSAEHNEISLNFTKEAYANYKKIVDEGNGSKDFGYLFQKKKNGK